jgi:AcrR family transcriptional regulator
VTKSPTPRRPRSDAVRNRAALLATARSAILGGESDIGLDEVARRTGVGIGTLYRHFANRRELLEALYREEVGTLLDLETELARSQPPDVALRTWLIAFVDVLIAKKVIGPALSAIIGPETTMPMSGDTLMDAVRRLASRAAEAGGFDRSIDPVDLLRAVSGTVGVAVDDRAGERARRMVDVLLAGARPT